MSVLHFLYPNPDRRLASFDAVQSCHSEEFARSFKEDRKKDISPGNHLRSPELRNLRKGIERRSWVSA
jgi:hypothetical protein